MIDIATNDMVGVQAKRQRNIEREQILDEIFDKDGLGRKERDSQIDFRKETRREQAEERHERNEKVRDLIRKKRQDAMKADRKEWEKKLDGKIRVQEGANREERQ